MVKRLREIVDEGRRAIRRLMHNVGGTFHRLVNKGVSLDNVRVHSGRVSRGNRSSRERPRPGPFRWHDRAYYTNRGYEENNRYKRYFRELAVGRSPWRSWRQRERDRLYELSLPRGMSYGWGMILQ